MPYTNRSKENLLREGFHLNRIFVIGNPIKEVIDFYESQISSSKILELLGIERKKYFLLTMHRAENVDWETRLRNLIEALCKIWQKFGFPIICSLHPRTREKIERFKINIEQKGLIFQEPFGFFDFVHLEKNALCVLTDSGTVQEECCIFKVPNVTIRDVTERPETVDCGSNILAGEDPEQIVNCTEIAISKSTDWNPPFEYLAQNVALTTAKIVLGYRWPDFAEQLWLESKSISRKHLTREK
jgi:UDP-N-acetylglucosamine 2-epimerase (non-hydrolysing)